MIGKLFRPREILDDLMPLEKAVGFVSFEPEGQPELAMSQPPLTEEFNEHRFLGHHIEVGEFPAELFFHRSRQVEADRHGRILVGPDDRQIHLTCITADRIGRRDPWGSAARHRSKEASDNRRFQEADGVGFFRHERLSPLPVFKVCKGGFGDSRRDHP